jgi:hypothetical protein
MLMNRKNLAWIAFLSALGIVAYSSGLEWWANTHGWPEPHDRNLLFSYFILACLIGLFLLFQPISFYFKGFKKEALRLFIYTVGFILGLTLVVVLSVKLYETYEDVTFPKTGQPCGGFIQNAPTCLAGFRCVHRPGSPGDVPGICVPD